MSKPRPAPSSLSGLLVLNKPTGITSAKALYKVRSLTGQRKSGHAGTLDPMASGVLVLCLGRATKMVESIMNLPKVYRATVRLDVTNECYDLEKPLIPVPVSKVPTSDELYTACATFEGVIEQTPPRFSAVKLRGVPAYKRAARNEEIELVARNVNIYWIHINRYDWPHLEVEMACGRGTYVRSFVRDLGKTLNVGGCLTSLVRRRVGPFVDDQGWSLDALEAADDPRVSIVDLDRATAMIASGTDDIPPRPGQSFA